MEWGISEMTKQCAYPQCQNCEFEYCIKDAPETQKKQPKKRDRRAYYKEYYRKKQTGELVPRTSKKQYVQYITLRNVVAGLKKQIGNVNYGIVMDAIEQIEKECLER